MNYGFFRTAAASFKLRVADPDYNKEEIKKAVVMVCICLAQGVALLGGVALLE